MASTPTVLIAAASGRALAASARRAGYAPLVTDFFGDEDTIAAAQAHVRIRPHNGRSIDPDELIAAFHALAATHDPSGAVCGTGFEDRPDVLARIAQHWTLIGNSPATVARIKDPTFLAALCRRCGIPHPDTRPDLPNDAAGWLAKRSGGAGGTHIRIVAGERTAPEAYYFQRRVSGDPVSALVLADGYSAMVLGFSAQWSSPAPEQPFRYGGAVQPAPLTRATAGALSGAVQQLTSLISLVGLNSFDFLVDGREFHLLEINPRPGATLDIFEPRGGASMFAMHVEACRGILPDTPPTYGRAAASAIVYADRDIPRIPSLSWPGWVGDRPIAGSSISAQSPLCTVFASAATAALARKLVDRRARAILARLRARPS
jgi:predicted ATP-grasp superfamily ATP-dependent carboligase